MEACSKASANTLHKKIVDQISAVENFTAFKKLMLKRNQELNQQAIKMMEHKEASAKKKAIIAAGGTVEPDVKADSNKLEGGANIAVSEEDNLRD
jgi:hypothetical protein